MLHGELKDYFISAASMETALDAYDRFAQQARGWPVADKLNLYTLAESAWTHNIATDERSVSFHQLMKNLRGYWQLNRPGGLVQDDEIFRLLKKHREVREVRRIGDDLPSVTATILELRRVKSSRSTWYSPMALSKILHFFNPSIFPIYDTALVENKVLRRFRDEWREYEPLVSLSRIHLHTGALYYLKYALWADSFLSSNRTQIMDVFCSWVRRHAPSDHSALTLIEGIDATAFEMIAIGAAHCHG